MVLEEASSNQEPSSSFSETQPTSDIDPYASGNSNPNYTATNDYSYIRLDQANADPIYISMASLPPPFFVPIPQQAHQQRMQRSLANAAAHTSQVLKRPLTKDEAEAIAFYNNKAVRIASLGLPVGLTIAGLRAYTTTDKGYRFPFWSPMKEGSGRSRDKFLTVRGPRARLLWSMARFTSWLWVGGLVGTQVFALYAASHSTVARLMDPRLKAFKDAAISASRERRGQSIPTQQNDGEGAKNGETYEMARQRMSVQRQIPAQRSRQQDDDMSPTGGAFQEDIRAGDADTGLMDDGQVRSYEYSRQQERVRANAEETFNSRPSSPAQQRTQQQQREVEQSNRSSPPSDQSRSKSSGSSWDRLRQDAMSGNQNQPSNQRNPRPAQDTRKESFADDSFSFSRGDEDQQLAKSEAQKDFDARIERERAGKDFSDGRGGGRW